MALCGHGGLTRPVSSEIELLPIGPALPKLEVLQIGVVCKRRMRGIIVQRAIMPLIRRLRKCYKLE